MFVEREKDSASWNWGESCWTWLNITKKKPKKKPQANTTLGATCTFLHKAEGTESSQLWGCPPSSRRAPYMLGPREKLFCAQRDAHMQPCHPSPVIPLSSHPPVFLAPHSFILPSHSSSYPRWRPCLRHLAQLAGWGQERMPRDYRQWGSPHLCTSVTVAQRVGRNDCPMALPEHSPTSWSRLGFLISLLCGRCRAMTVSMRL